MKPIKGPRNQRGTQIVEMAIVLPLLALLALMVTEGADFVRVHTVLNNAAREGARLSSLQENKGQTAGIVAAVQQYITDESSGRVKGTDAKVTVDQGLQIATDNGSGTVMMGASKITVTYAYTFQYLPNFMTSGLPTTLQAQSEFRNFY
jgi:Flp pilus assembly protein TadG